MKYRDFIREIYDFPKKGIVFKDITPIFKDSKIYEEMLDDLGRSVENLEFDYIAGIEARGFLIGAPLAIKLGKGFIPIRKRGKLPGEVIRAEYDLEYGSNVLEMHTDAFEPGSKILIIDDLLATGGTVTASIEMIEKLQGTVAGLAFVIELTFLNGREKLKGYPLVSLIKE